MGKTLSLEETFKLLWYLMTSADQPFSSRLKLCLLSAFVAIPILSIISYILLKFSIYLLYTRIVKRTQKKRNALITRHLIATKEGAVELIKRARIDKSRVVLNKVPVIFGFFHPNSAAKSGSERILWAGIKQIQENIPSALCVIYNTNTQISDNYLNKEIKRMYGIEIDPERIWIEHIKSGGWMIDSRSWPILSFMMQAIGSVILAIKAASQLPPDAFIDTIGAAFCYPIIKSVFDCPVVTYVHYPKIRIEKVRDRSFSFLKRFYLTMLWLIYVICGRTCDIVMTNSSWTQEIIKSYWGQGDVVYPPCQTDELAALPLDGRNENTILTVAQFREDKGLEDLMKIIAKVSEMRKSVKFILCGSLRDAQDRIYLEKLRQSVKDLGIENFVEFHVDLAWPQLVQLYRQAKIGVNPLREEHFGMTVVEYQSAGVIAIAHSSGGPGMDIIKPGTGFLAVDEVSFVDCIIKALDLDPEQYQELQLKARKNAERFSMENFKDNWLDHFQNLRKKAILTRGYRMERTNDSIDIGDLSFLSSDMKDYYEL